ncbi:MAG TPA: DUF2306 domain-containing protein [Hyphomicrobiaceae bacterium]|nr:DUF2306 domain-containing protein [Hyphomicrobiaceae bacterium]
MTLEPILAAGPAIQIHTLAALGAFLTGGVQLWRPKGGPSHRTLGWIWVGLMAVVAASAFWIHEIRLWGQWSPIHLLSIAVLIQLPLAVYAARRHKISAHKRTMTGLYLGALIIAGLFTLMPGRILGRMIFG